MGCGPSTDNNAAKSSKITKAEKKNAAKSPGNSWSNFFSTNPTEIDLSKDGRAENVWMGIDPEKRIVLEDIPPEVWQCTSCTKLVISNHGIKGLPPVMFDNMTNLVNLEFSDGDLEEVSASIAKLTKLETLELYRNKIKTVAPEIGSLPNLAELNLYDNAIKKVPTEINDLSSLTSLNLGSNAFLVLPSVDKLANLENLQIQWGKVCKITGELEGLTKLTNFMASKNRLSTVPKFPASIETIDISCNFVEELADFAHCNAIKEINVNQNGIKEIPASIFTESLEVFKMEKTEVTSIPEEIGNCPNLFAIFTMSSKLTSLPAAITKCTKLKKVDFRKNEALLTSQKEDANSPYNQVKTSSAKFKDGIFYE